MDPVLKRIGILALIVGVLYICWLLLPILPPFFAALVLAYFLDPVVNKLARYTSLPRWLIILMLYLAITVVLAALLWWLVPSVWAQLMYAKDHIPEAITWINTQLRPWLKENLRIKTDRVGVDQLLNWSMVYLQQNYDMADTRSALLNIVRSGFNVINVVGLVVLVPVVTFFFLLNWQDFVQKMHQLIPRRLLPRAMYIMRECDDVLMAFVKGQLLVMLALGGVYAVGLELVGIQLGLIIGIIAGLASIIPYLGFTLGLVSAVIACLFQYGFDVQMLFMVGIVFGIGQMIEGYVLQPLLLGDKIGLSPVAVIFSVLAGAQLDGLVGMLLALPVAAILVVVFKHILAYYQHSNWYLGDDPATVKMPKKTQNKDESLHDFTQSNELVTTQVMYINQANSASQMPYSETMDTPSSPSNDKCQHSVNNQHSDDKA